MFLLRLDSQSDLIISWPRTNTDIIKLGEAYVAHEQSLPESDRLALPALPHMETLLAAAKSYETAAIQGETKRAAAAETFQQTMTKVKERFGTAIIKLKAKYLDNLAQLEAWGLNTTIGARNNIRVHRPRKQADWKYLVQTYVAKEQSLPEAERIADPPLAEMEALAQTLLRSEAERDGGRQEREIGVQRRGEAAQTLLTHLQLAAANLIVIRFEGRLTDALQRWGYQVVSRSKKGSATPAPPVGEGEAGE